jgi:hypothetical protein
MSMHPLKICVQKMSKRDEEHLKHLKSLSGSSQQYSKLSAAFYTAKLWPNNSTIKVAFIEEPSRNLERTSIQELKSKRDSNGNALEIDPLQYEVGNMDIISAVKKIVNERINPIVNLKFVFIDDPKESEIRIAFDAAQGAWSLLGTDCLSETDHTQPTMNLGWFDVATTIHEFLHALGLIHEHQNPKDNLIQWNKKAVYKWAEQTQGWNESTTYHNIIEKYDSNQINGSVYDPESIMLYFFPASLTLNNKGTQQNLKLSAYDVQYLNSVYPNSPETPKQFYQRVYNGNLDEELSELDKSLVKFRSTKISTSNVIMWICIIFGVSILLFIVVKLFFIKSNNKPANFIKNTKSIFN